MIYEILEVSAAYQPWHAARAPCCSCRMEHGSAVREFCWGKLQNPPEGLDHTEQEGMSEGAATDGWHRHCCCRCTHKEGFQGCPAPAHWDPRVCFSGVFFFFAAFGNSFLKALHCLQWLGKHSAITKILILMYFSFCPADRMVETCPFLQLARNLLH